MMILIIMGIVVRMRAEVAKVGAIIFYLVCFASFHYYNIINNSIGLK